MLYDCKRISYWTDRRLAGLAGPDYDATISFGLPFEPGDSQYRKYRMKAIALAPHFPYQPCRACRNQQQRYPM